MEQVARCLALHIVCVCDGAGSEVSGTPYCVCVCDGAGSEVSGTPYCVCVMEQVARCLALLEMNAGAARRFYQLAVGHLTPSHTVRFMLALHKTVSHCVEEGEGEEMEEGREVVREKRRDDLRNHVIKGDWLHTINYCYLPSPLE